MSTGRGVETRERLEEKAGRGAERISETAIGEGGVAEKEGTRGGISASYNHAMGTQETD